MTATWACGHRGVVSSDVSEAPVCPHCGERRVSDVKAPAPRFRGPVTGPCVVGTIEGASDAPG